MTPCAYPAHTGIGLSSHYCQPWHPYILFIVHSQEDKEHELISPDMTILDFFSGMHSSSVWSELVHVAGNQGRDTKEGLIIAAVGRLHHIPPRLIISPAKTVTHAGLAGWAGHIEQLTGSASPEFWHQAILNWTSRHEQEIARNSFLPTDRCTSWINKEF